MRRSRFSEEQIIRILKEHQAGLGVKELCRRHGISDATFYKWRSKFGGMEVSDAKRLKALELEKFRQERAAAGPDRRRVQLYLRPSRTPAWLAGPAPRPHHAHLSDRYPPWWGFF